MMQVTDLFDQAGHIGLAIAMAVLMGLAFEGVYKREERTSPGGIRTFPMLAILGVVLYLLEPKSLVPYVAGLGVVGIWLYAHIRCAPIPDTPRPGLMVPAANLLAYTLGPAALTQPAWLVVAATVAAVLLLEGRERLHRLVLMVPSYEVFTLSKFLILVGIVLPLVPDRPIVTWMPITPFKAWLALVAVSSLSYMSYLVQRYFPRPLDTLWYAILGGAYSSTATTVALARQQHRSATVQRDLAVGIVAATAMMYPRIDAVVALFDMQLAWRLLPGLLGLFALAICLASWLWYRYSRDASSSAATPEADNPLQLGTAVTFAVLFVALAAASSWVGRTFGQQGVHALAALTGLTDIDPFVLSLAQGSVAGMSLPSLAASILVATASNNVVKACYALAFGGARAELWPALALMVLAAAGAATALLYLHG